jgi:superfamily I DNA and/or RNA helicase
MTGMLEAFVNTFTKAINLEMEAMQQRMGSFLVPLAYEQQLRIEKDTSEYIYCYRIIQHNDKLSTGMQCSLRILKKEYAVEIIELKDNSVVLSCSNRIISPDGDTSVLVIYPWFIYEKLKYSLGQLTIDNPGLTLAFKTFGKIPSQISDDPEFGFKTGLNFSQNAAISKTLGSELSFIWGPPGTGKTYTLTHLLYELIKRDKRVLVVSTTNNAVDTVISKLNGLEEILPMFMDGYILRIGRNHPDCRFTGFQYIIQKLNEINLEKLDSINNDLQTKDILLNEINEYISYIDKFNGTEQQLSLFGSSENTQRINEKTLSAMHKVEPEFYDMRLPQQKKRLLQMKAPLDKERQDLMNRRTKIEKLLNTNPRMAVKHAKIIFSTMAALYTGDILKNELFDCIIIEEAGMAVLPSLFYSITMAREKSVIVGDPMQLPPVVQSSNPFVKKAMGRSIYQVALDEVFSSPSVHLLDTQYRMHPDIGDVVSDLYYHGKLKNGVQGSDRFSIVSSGPEPGKSLIIYDLKGESFCQRQGGSYSRVNETSAKVVIECVKQVSHELDIGIITPYAEQSKYINNLLKEERLPHRSPIKCSTVHKFQGNERDVIIIDLTDAEPLEPGVLVKGSDSGNLLNVAVSRGRGKVIVIGEIEYFRNRAKGSPVVSLLERMSVSSGTSIII